MSQNLMQTQNLMAEDSGDANALFVFLDELAGASEQITTSTRDPGNSFILDKSTVDGPDLLDRQGGGWVQRTVI